MRAEALSAYPCHLDGRPVEASVEKDGLAVDGRLLAWLDMDEVRVEGWNVQLDMAGQPAVVLTQLGRGRDDFLAELRAARSPVRRAALLQWTGDRAVDSYVAHAGGEPETVTLFPDGLTVEPLIGPPVSVPLGLVQAVRREGYAITLEARGLAPTTIRQLGPRTDEFLEDLDRARATWPSGQPPPTRPSTRPWAGSPLPTVGPSPGPRRDNTGGRCGPPSPASPGPRRSTPSRSWPATGSAWGSRR